MQSIRFGVSLRETSTGILQFRIAKHPLTFYSFPSGNVH